VLSVTNSNRAFVLFQLKQYKITGACYTFGSPPVGTKAFDDDIKTPIYRVVNHVDIVPRLPNPILVHGVRLLALLVGVVLSPFAGFIAQVKESAWFDKLSKALIDAQKSRKLATWAEHRR